MVDAHRYLLGDTNGMLYMVHLTTEEHMDGDTVVTAMKMERLGEVGEGLHCYDFLDAATDITETLQ